MVSVAPTLPLCSFLSACIGLSHNLRNENFNEKGPELDYQILSENLALLKAGVPICGNIRSQISIYSSVELVLLTFMMLVINNTMNFQGDNAWSLLCSLWKS